MTAFSRRTLSGPVACAVLALASCNPQPEGQANAAPRQEATAANLTSRPNLSADVEAMPRLVGEGPAVAAINADLDRADAAAVQSATQCASDAGDGPGGGWSRSITRPMTGPAYLTLGEQLEYYCGGPYPSNAQTAVTYDLATGRRVDWVTALPGLELSVSTFDDMPPDYVPLVSSGTLGTWYGRKMLASPDAEWVEQCRDVFDPEGLADQTFNIWADAQSGGVSVSPDFAHVIKACGETATLTLEDLRRFDASPALIQAITSAQAAGNWAPKEDET